MRRQTVELADVDLAVFRQGDGVPLICLHGGMGLDSRSLRVPGILNCAGDGIEVIIYDQRGHGGSGSVAERTLIHAQWADDISGLAGALGFDRYYLLGHSYGGFIALEHVLRAHDRVKGLILVSTSAGPVDMPGKQLPDDASLRERMAVLWPHFFHGNQRFETVLEETEFSVAAYNAAFYRELPNYDVSSQLKDIMCPTLLIVGTHDTYLKPMMDLNDAIVNSKLVRFDHCGHFPFLEWSEKFTGQVRRFVPAS